MGRKHEFAYSYLFYFIPVSLIYTTMKNKKIILTGGTGFMGQEMTKYFGKENKIIILTRQVNEKTNRNDYDSLSANDLKNVTWIKWDAQPVDPAGRGKTAGDPIATGWVNEMN